MSLERALVQAWRRDAVLSAAVPVGRVRLGVAAGQPPLPYVVFDREPGEPPTLTSSGTLVERPVLAICCWAATSAEAERVAAAAMVRLRGLTAEWDGARLADLRPLGSALGWDERGAWRASVQLRALVIVESERS